jgi:N-acetylneuraminate synthase
MTDAELLKHHCKKGKPLIISTGMSSMEETRAAVNLVRDLIGDQFILMHTVSMYPCENHELNLNVLTTLRNEFKVPVGYSGHEKGVVPSVMAAAMGAVAIERHITLDRAMWGSDQAASLEPPGFQLLLRDIRVWEEARGTGIKSVHEKEIPIKQKLRRKSTLRANGA